MTNRTVLILLALFLVAFWAAVLTGVLHWLSPKDRVYDCSTASFHPDVPKEVKAKCREVRT